MRTLSVSPLLSLVLFATDSTLAQAPMDDAMWIAARNARTLTKVDRCGAVLQTVDLRSNGFDLDMVGRAPDGKLWVINFIGCGSFGTTR